MTNSRKIDMILNGFWVLDSRTAIRIKPSQSVLPHEWMPLQIFESDPIFPTPKNKTKANQPVGISWTPFVTFSTSKFEQQWRYGNVLHCDICVLCWEKIWPTKSIRTVAIIIFHTCVAGSIITSWVIDCFSCHLSSEWKWNAIKTE